VRFEPVRFDERLVRLIEAMRARRAATARGA
jgi:hypothetical protein